MNDKVLPLRPSRAAQAPPARIDVTAVELLTAGRARSLQAARVEAILADLRMQRERFVALLADLRGRGSEDRVEGVAAEAALFLAIARGIVEIDAFIAGVQGMTEMGDRACKEP